MLDLLRSTGLVGLVLLALSVVTALGIVRSARQLRRGAPASRPDFERGVHAILFWGVLGSFVGFLGHSAGIYTSLSVLSEVEEVAAADVVSALRLSMVPSFWGLGLLTLAAAAWCGLRAWHGSLAADPTSPAS